MRLPNLVKRLYYFFRPIMPRSVQITLRRHYVQFVRQRSSHVWPIDNSSDRIPNSFSGWPEKKSFVLVLRHDVETSIGQRKCIQLIDIEKQMGFRSVFNFVPLRYTVSEYLRMSIVQGAFEVGVHGLKHDGKLFLNRKTFNKRTISINAYLSEWDAVGFSSPSSHNNLKWMWEELNIAYDSSTFDTDPFEPQPKGAETIFPFWVGDTTFTKGFVELPYTLPQDFTLFVLLKERSIDIWKRKVDWIVEKGGMVLLNTHPDYMSFGGKIRMDEYSCSHYIDLLEYIKGTYEGRYWHVLPKELAHFWRERCRSAHIENTKDLYILKQ